jgi:predicted nuclease with TOPRIM domain
MQIEQKNKELYLKNTQEKSNEIKLVQELLNIIEKERSRLENDIQQQNNYLQQKTQQTENDKMLCTGITNNLNKAIQDKQNKIAKKRTRYATVFQYIEDYR